MSNESNNTNMESNIYPMFRDGQVLSSNDLNLLFSYLNEQDKKTRSMLYGYGVISGLMLSVKKEDDKIKSITISKGQAVTKSGNIIDIQEDKEYMYINEKNNCLMTEAKSENIKTISEFVGSNDLLNYFVKIDYKVEACAIEYCKESSCNIRSSVNKIAYIPKLLKKQDTDNKYTTNDIEELVLDRVVNVLNSKELSVFLRAITNSYYGNLAKIKEKIETLIENTAPLLKTTQQNKTEKETGGDTEDMTIEKLKRSVEKLVSEVFRFDTTNAEPYLSFILDMQKAINEFICVYNMYMMKYGQTINKDEENNSVILGDLIGVSSDIRQQFEEAYQDYGQARSHRVVKRHAKRIAEMIDAFSPKIESGKNIILPTLRNGLLGEQVVPTYYNLSDVALKEVWDAHNFQHISKYVLTQDKNEKMQANNYLRADTFVISNYSYKCIDDFSREVNEQINKYNIPITLVSFDLDGKRESLRLEENDITNLEVKDIDKCFGEISSIALSYNKNNTLFKKTKDVINKCAMKHSKESKIIEASKYLTQNLRNSDLEEVRQAIYLYLNKTEQPIPRGNKYILAFILRAIVYALKGNEDTLKPAFRGGIEYIGGVNRNNAMVAVCHDKRVLLCLNLHYFSADKFGKDYTPLHETISQDIEADIKKLFTKNVIFNI